MSTLSSGNRHHRWLPVNVLFGKAGFFVIASFYSVLSSKYGARIGGQKAEYLRSLMQANGAKHLEGWKYGLG